MRIVEVVERSVPLSRYAGVAPAPGGLTTSIVALRTDVVRDGKAVVGYGFSSFGRFAQSGLIRERFAPRLLAPEEEQLVDETGSNLDPFRAWNVMLRGEKPGGHGERCVAVGTLDMAIWDAVAKIAGLPLHRFIAARVASARPSDRVPVYAAGGYVYPHDDLRQGSMRNCARFCSLATRTRRSRSVHCRWRWTKRESKPPWASLAWGNVLPSMP